jgi:hypothetical protein
VLGNTPPPKVVINEMTTVASVWTANQFIDGTVIKGHSLGLKIAADNVPNFVDLQTGGWGLIIQEPLNSGQTRTMAKLCSCGLRSGPVLGSNLPCRPVTREQRNTDLPRSCSGSGDRTLRSPSKSRSFIEGLSVGPRSPLPDAIEGHRR